MTRWRELITDGTPQEPVPQNETMGEPQMVTSGAGETGQPSSIVLCRCGHERDKHGSRTEQRRGEKVYVQKCEQCPCETFVDKDGPLSRMIDSFQTGRPVAPTGRTDSVPESTGFFPVAASGETPPADEDVSLRARLTRFVGREQALLAGVKGQTVGHRPSITPSVLKALQQMLRDTATASPPPATTALREALEVILQTVKGDEKSECWTIRKWLDDRDIFNDDLSGSERLIEAVCRAALRTQEQS